VCGHEVTAGHRLGDQGDAADADPGHVGDGVERARPAEADLDARLLRTHQTSSERPDRRRFSTHHASTLLMTTLDCNSDEHGREAARLLLEIVRGETPAQPRRIIPVSLIERASTARRRSRLGPGTRRGASWKAGPTARAGRR
jgi:hypothetical protein